MPIAPSSALLSPPDDRERLYRELWPVIRAMLRTRYAGLDDYEELYQEAWTELLEYEAGGKEVGDTRALLKTIADRRARDRVRSYHAVVLEPDDAAFVETADSAPLPDEQAQVRLGAARIRHVIDTLDDREAQALKLRYDLLLDASEISRRMQVTPRHLEKVMTAAYRHVAEALATGHDGESPWSRRQRSLLLACETGFASARQRRHAERMLATDPQSRVMLAELRVALRDVAAALPLPVLVDDERVRRRMEWVLDAVDRVLPGGHRAARQMAEGAAGTGASDSIGVGVGVIGAGGVAKFALACLAAGGTVAVCLSSRPEPTPKPPTAKRTAPTVRAARPAPPAVDQIRPASSTPKVPEVTKVNKTPKRRAKQPQQPPAKTRNTVVSSPQYRQVASPAPPASTEFGPGVLGSSPPPTQPAPAPTGGGGEFTP